MVFISNVVRGRVCWGIAACFAMAGCSDASQGADVDSVTIGLNPDVVVELPLDEGAGSVAADVSGNGNDGVLVGGAAFEADTGDGSAFAVRFDGVDDSIDLGSLDVDGSGLTLAAWFNADSFPGPSSDPRLISKASGTAGDDHVFMLSTIQQGAGIWLRARVRVGGSTTTLVASSGNLVTGEWRHAALTYDGATLRLYVDAVEVGSTPLSGAVDVDPSVPVAVGGQPPGAGPRYFDGLIDDVRILPRALSVSELMDIFESNQTPNEPPVAGDDDYATQEDSALAVDALSGVLANDTDPELEPLQAILAVDVSNGVLNLNPDGSFDYNPNPDFSGADQFTYRASDGVKVSALATVTLTVNGENDPPIATDDSYSIQSGTQLLVAAAAGVLANDTDPELDPLQAILVSDVSDGVLGLSSDGSFDYTPNQGFTGQDTFSYLANDASLDSNLAIVTITVSDTSDPDVVLELPLDEGAGTVASDVSGNGNDGVLVGGAVFEADSGDGSAFAVRFDGADDYIDLGALDVSGSGLTLAAWFNADDFPGPSSDPRLISKATGTVGNDHVFMLGTIQDGAAVRLRARVRVGGSTTTLIAGSGDLLTGEWRHAAVTYDGTTLRLYLDAVEVGSTSLSGAVDVDASVPVTVGSQPPGAGLRFFDGLIDDARILSRALSASELSDIFESNQTPNEPPVAGDDGYALPEDSLLAVNAADGVLANDTDPELDPLQAILIGNVSSGVLSLNLDGSFDYSPNPNFSGVDQFTYRASDGAKLSALATVTLTVNGENDAPVAIDDSYSIQLGSGLLVDAASGVLANDTDPELDPLQAILVVDVTDGVLNLNPDGSFDYTPNQGFSGQDSFTYRANDASLDSNLASVTITLDTANSQPYLVTGSISFAKQVVDDTLGETHAAAAADFTGDGLLDLVATDYVDGMVFWYENDGNGGFIARVLDADLEGAYPIGVGDVDGDGETDVLAAGYDADTFVWYQSDGSGGFTRRLVDGASDGAHSIVTGDMDDDGDVDLLTSSQDANTIAWYENDGANGFTLRVIDTSSLGAKRAEFADIDGDGDKDVVTASFFNYEIAWHENDGSENFTKRVIDTTAMGAYFVSTGDIDGDGDLDVLSASQDDNTIAWYRNDGALGFSPLTINSAAAGARTVLAADIDGNGTVDAVSASVDDDTIAWYENDGSGGFTGKLVDADADGAYGIFTIDFNGDGLLDIISASRDAAELAIHRQKRTHVATVDPAGTLTIDYQLLRAEDPDDAPSELTYTVTAAPSFGALEVGGAFVGLGGTFTQEDVESGRLTYVHFGLSESADRFDFAVADGGEGRTGPVSGSFVISVAGFEGYVVQLPLDEGTGSVASDVSGLDNDGTLVNGAVFEASTGDGSASAVRFDGVDDLIELGGLDVNGTGLTLAAWFNADGFPGPSSDPRLISKATGTAENEHVFMIGTIQQGPDVRLRARIRHGGVTTTLIATSGNLVPGVWHHAAVTYDGTTVALYLDGVEVGRSLFFGAIDIDPSSPVVVGGQPVGAGSRYFDGLIDDIRILSRGLSATEVAQFAAGGN